MATVWTTMEKTAEGRFVESGYHTTEPDKWYRCFTVEDPQEFIAHMRRFNRIPKKPLNRTEYEKVCQEFGVSPAEDKDLKIYGTTLTTLGTRKYDPRFALPGTAEARGITKTRNSYLFEACSDPSGSEQAKLIRTENKPLLTASQTRPLHRNFKTPYSEITCCLTLNKSVGQYRHIILSCGVYHVSTSYNRLARH